MEFIQQYIIDSKIYIQLIPIAFGLVVWKKLDQEYKLFVLLLVYSVLNEMFKIYYGNYIDVGYNKILTNIYNIIYLCFLFWIYYTKGNSAILKRIIVMISIIYALSIGWELFVKPINYHRVSQVTSYIIGGLGILIIVFFYFFSLINSDKIINVYSNLLFWISIAHFIYYLAFILFKIVENDYAAFEEYHYLFKIKIPVTAFKSLILSIGFILCSQQKNPY